MSDKRKKSALDERENVDQNAYQNGEPKDWTEQAISKHLDSQVENLDFVVSSKLSAARHRALDAAASKPGGVSDGSRWLIWTRTGAGVAVAAIAVILVTQFYPSGNTPIDNNASPQTVSTQAGSMIEDLQLLSATDDIEFYQSLEFLEWMQNNSG